MSLVINLVIVMPNRKYTIWIHPPFSFVFFINLNFSNQRAFFEYFFPELDSLYLFFYKMNPMEDLTRKLVDASLSNLDYAQGCQCLD